MAASTEIEHGDQLMVQFNDQGLAPAIVQDVTNGDILMVAWMNEEALHHTITTGKTTFYSRSRQKLWVKGESSGNVMHVQELRVDCDQDAIVVKVTPAGAACHNGYRSCFYRVLDREAGTLNTDAEPLFDPKDVYGK